MGDLRALSDRERKITDAGRNRAVWSLERIQAALAKEPPLRVIFSMKAQAEMTEQLGWKAESAIAFLNALSRGRYNGSEWCYLPKATTPCACDSYVMGFNRFTGLENQQCDPWVYFKFGLIGANKEKVAVFSAHPAGQ